MVAPGGGLGGIGTLTVVSCCVAMPSELYDSCQSTRQKPLNVEVEEAMALETITRQSVKT